LVPEILTPVGDGSRARHRLVGDIIGGEF